MANGLRNSIKASDTEIQYDKCAKTVLSHKSLLSHILAAVTDDFKGMDPKQIEACIDGDVYVSQVSAEPGLTNDRIKGFNTVDSEISEGEIHFDIIFYVKTSDGLSQIIVNLEAQKNAQPEYNILNRALYYVSRMVSSQKNRDFANSNYDDLKKVYSIWICMNMKECVWNHIHLTNNSILGSYEWNGKIDLMNAVLLGVPNDIPEKGDKYELHRLLSALFSVKLNADERINVLEKEYNIAVEPELRKEMANMCNLSQGVLEIGVEQGFGLGFDKGIKQGIEQGIERGIERGIEQGIERGENETKRKMIINMNNKGFSSDIISEITGMAVNAVEKIIADSIV